MGALNYEQFYSNIKIYITSTLPCYVFVCFWNRRCAKPRKMPVKHFLTTEQGLNIFGDVLLFFVGFTSRFVFFVFGAVSFCRGAVCRAHAKGVVLSKRCISAFYVPSWRSLFRTSSKKFLEPFSEPFLPVKPTARHLLRILFRTFSKAVLGTLLRTLLKRFAVTRPRWCVQNTLTLRQENTTRTLATFSPVALFSL